MNKLHIELEKALVTSQVITPGEGAANKCYDPELLYVECKHCGRPVLWEPGRTTAILMQSDISPSSVDEHCLILSDGCRECMPGNNGFHLSIVRLANISVPAALLMLQTPVGNA